MKQLLLVLLLSVSITWLLGCSEKNIITGPELNANTNTTPPSAPPYQVGDDIPALAYIEHNETYNAESVIPPQCYTKTNGVNNPCYACHQTDRTDLNRPNQMADGNLQGDYEFSDLGVKNHWKNLFVDRTDLIKGISDKKILDWINQDNYSEFIKKQQANSQWLGEITPIKNLAYPEKAFNSQGFAKDGSGWVAFNYKPFPSTFWPTNGSTGDVMIRLPSAFREVKGVYNQDAYLANLSLVELALKGLETISTPPINEQRVGTDLNSDGKLTTINHITKQSNYVGDATAELAYQLYPEGTEFLHTVRYIGVDSNGAIFNAPRMKEVRYMKKHNFKSKQELGTSYYREAKEKSFENLPQTLYLGDQGINNSFGWTINGYIEDAQGKLRPQHKQELAFCNGCHKTVGSTYDQTFSFARKVTGKKGWGYIDLKSMTDVPNKGETDGEFLTYMTRVGGGDEFRQNQEMLMRWFNADGKLNTEKVKATRNLYELITPSPERALALNKAYLSIVKEQSYLFGRDATLVKAHNVLEQVNDSQQPLKPEHRYVWDMQLAWTE
ncbi:hypothetical protein PCIT_b0842 [Pseudoalteromonas citrea]|uniref:Lipoprotein n=2 Tax=Pseudoalteromonas citrea TaxID=43655 RepID=A0AAD4FQ69_9GAMM|nr:hypothetical protein [Pseudoalteromonas citrea]KAF7764776.1 hypothetical protein PCIT_b0842 [Pseudoalteromonas citrea]